MAVNRTPVVVVAGFDPLAVDAVASAMAVPGTVVVHHDLAALSQGSMTRTIYDHDTTGAPLTRVTQIDLVHGCVSCALREDLLPLLRSLHRRGRVERIVLALDPSSSPSPCAGPSTMSSSPTCRGRSTVLPAATWRSPR